MDSDNSDLRRIRLHPRSPKGGRPTQEVAGQLREHILDVALEEFVRSGPSGASMERIAAAAKVSKRTLYTRFESRSGLMLAAVSHGVARTAQPIADNLPEGSPRAQILHVTRQMLDASLTEAILGLEALVEWIFDHGLDGSDSAPHLGLDTGANIIESILAAAGEEAEERSFLAAYIFDALVLIPRMRILQPRGMPNTASAKDEYQSRTVAFLARAIPTLAE